MPKASKGAAYEREFCKQLSLWWSSGTDDGIFWRTSQSGGRATSRRKAGKRADRHCGDVCAVDPIGKPFTDFFAVEIKRGYSSSSVADLLDKPARAAKQTYEKWIEQAERSREQSGSKHWLLVVKRDQREPVAFMSSEAAIEVGLIPVLTNYPRLKIYLGGWRATGVPLAKFFEVVEPATFNNRVIRPAD